jgi:hypothetical protein
VGTARAGTTSLHYYLKQHPQIFLPDQKEPCYYCFAGEKPDYRRGKFAFTVTNGADYSRLFKAAPADSVKGEISTPYLYLYEKTIANIRRLHADHARLKIIIILRNPADRAYSQYLWKLRDGREELSFEEALHQEKKRMLQNYSFDYFYAHRGLYYNQVKAWMDAFPQVKIFLHDEFKSNLHETLNSLCIFLGVDAGFEFERRDDMNASRMPRFASLGRIITMESKAKYKMLNVLPDSIRITIKEQFMRWNSSKNQLPAMSSYAKEYLANYYFSDLQKLQQLTGLNLSAWINSR